jgi:hypothetical protein
VVFVAAVIVGNNVARLVVPGQDLALAVELELPIWTGPGVPRCGDR